MRWSCAPPSPSSAPMPHDEGERRVLAALCAGFTEGVDAPDLGEARELVGLAR